MVPDERSLTGTLRPRLAAAAALLAALGPALVIPPASGCADCLDGMPAGSYKASCKDCEVDCTVLACVCDGRRTELDVSECEPGTEVWNDHGSLRCGDTGPSCIRNDYACGPSGAYVSACCSGYCGPTGTCK